MQTSVRSCTLQLAGCRTRKGDKANLFGDTSEGLILKKIDEGGIKVADVVAMLPEVSRNFPQNSLPRQPAETRHARWRQLTCLLAHYLNSMELPGLLAHRRNELWQLLQSPSKMAGRGVGLDALTLSTTLC